MGDDEDDMDDGLFDFGKAKMDYFKKRAKEILTSDNKSETTDFDPLPTFNLGNAYKNLKMALRNPVVVHSGSSETKPHYMKMTFSMCRNAVKGGERFLEISKLQT